MNRVGWSRWETTRLRESGEKRRLPRGVATLEVVLATGLIIPSLMLLLYAGFRAMAAFMSVLGTMIGSPLV